MPRADQQICSGHLCEYNPLKCPFYGDILTSAPASMQQMINIYPTKVKRIGEGAIKIKKCETGERHKRPDLDRIKTVKKSSSKFPENRSMWKQKAMVI